MKRIILAAVVGSVLAPALAAQQPAGRGPMGTDTPPMWRQNAMRRPMDPARMEQLRQQVEERWGRMVQERLQLTDQQMDRVRTATRAHQDRRRDVARRRVDLERGIGQQMQPGVAANQDSLDRMLDRMARLRVEEAQSDEQLNRDLGFLTPVQRAQFFMMSRRFEERLREIRERRLGPDGAGPVRERAPAGGRRPQGMEEEAEPLDDGGA